MKKSIFMLSALAISSTIFFSACSEKKEDKQTTTPDESFYATKLGGETKVADPKNSGQMIEQGRLNLRSVVDSTIFVIAADTNLNDFFPVLLAEVGGGDFTGFTKLSKNLTDFFCVATGAKNFAYTGANMKDSHDPAKNTRMNGKANDIDFTRFVKAVGKGAEKCGITDPTIVNPIVALLETLRGDVVQVPFYDLLGGTTKVSDPANSGQMIETGRLNLRSVVDSTIFIIAADDQLNDFFPVLLAEVGNGDFSGFTTLSKNLTDFFCVATGAKNFTYTGMNMKDAHDPAKNSRMNGKAANADFDRFIVDVAAGAAKCGVTNPEVVGEVARIINTVRADVVQK